MFGKSRKTENQEEQVYNEEERRSNARFFAVLLSVLAVIMLFLNFWTTNFSFVLVSGSSMDKTLYSGEYLLSYKVVNPEYELERGDIIVVNVSHIPEWQKENEGKPAHRQTHFIIKRLIGLEGDIVRCENGEMEICYAGTWNETMAYADYPFVALDEPYAYYDENKGGKNAVCNTFEYTVGDGEIFFLGDNRNTSSDSRYGIKNQDGTDAGYSQLDGRLYKIADVTATVPNWALKRQKGLQKYLVEIPEKIKKVLLKPFRELKK
ncbi:MAG: signal peptidase I [Clostridia bacterium]|nr:signal peptidase I [Clostridia bacterium]